MIQLEKLCADSI